MKIPTPNEFAAQAGFKPFPPRWEQWLSAMRAAILSAAPVAGTLISTDEHPGHGTVVNVSDDSQHRRGKGWVPPGGGGGPGGPGGPGACCDAEGNCTPDVTKADCEDGGGTFQGGGSECSPNPCVECSDSLTLCKCGFDTFVPSSPAKKYLTKTTTGSFTASGDNVVVPGGHGAWSMSATKVEQYSPYTCTSACISCAGDASFELTETGEGDCTGTGSLSCSGSTPCAAGFTSPMLTVCAITFEGDGDNCGILCFACTPNANYHTTPGAETETTRTTDYNIDPTDITGSGSVSETLSDEYTTELLIANTLAAFMASCHCPEGFVVTYELNEDETCCTASCVPA